MTVKKQRLYLIRNNAVVEEFVISTAVNGVGNKMDSEQTPTGLHSLEKMIGEGVPENGIFINRVFNGDLAQVNLSKTPSPGDMVTGRILWLKGEEEGVNNGGQVDSYSRNIYIHGTPDAGLLGMPASHGCIRMSNKDVVNLFKQMRKGDYVIILNN
ncbi:MAG: L,D-transpeptidase family protein [Flavobacteriales bacterium]